MIFFSYIYFQPSAYLFWVSQAQFYWWKFVFTLVHHQDTDGLPFTLVHVLPAHWSALNQTSASPSHVPFGNVWWCCFFDAHHVLCLKKKEEEEEDQQSLELANPCLLRQRIHPPSSFPPQEPHGNSFSGLISRFYSQTSEWPLASRRLSSCRQQRWRTSTLLLYLPFAGGANLMPHPTSRCWSRAARSRKKYNTGKRINIILYAHSLRRFNNFDTHSGLHQSASGCWRCCRRTTGSCGWSPEGSASPGPEGGQLKNSS